jgi:hypothetical protein
MLSAELGAIKQNQNSNTAPLVQLNIKKQANEVPSELNAKLNRPPSPSSFLNFDKNYAIKPEKQAKSLRWMDLEQKA